MAILRWAGPRDVVQQPARRGRAARLPQVGPTAAGDCRGPGGCSQGWVVRGKARLRCGNRAAIDGFGGGEIAGVVQVLGELAAPQARWCGRFRPAPWRRWRRRARGVQDAAHSRPCARRDAIAAAGSCRHPCGRGRPEPRGSSAPGGREVRPRHSAEFLKGEGQVSGRMRHLLADGRQHRLADGKRSAEEGLGLGIALLLVERVAEDG